MPLIPFSPPPGLNSDDTTFSAEGRWADASNVRFHQDKPQVINGWVSAATITSGQSVGELGVFQNREGTVYWIAGSSGSVDKLWADVAGSGVFTDITPVSNWTSPGFGCSFAQWGNTILASPVNGRLFRWTMGGGAAVEIAAAPDQIRTILVSPQRQVIALGCNEEVSGAFNARCIRGSDIEDETDWTTTSTNNAFEHILDDTGSIVTGRFVGDYLAVLTSTSLWMGTFVGDPGQAWQFQHVQSGCGITPNRNAACVSGGLLYWMGGDLSLWAWAPGAPAARIPCPVSKDFRDNIADPTLIRVEAIPHFDEIWIFYADGRDGGDWSRYIAFNREGQWFRGALGRAAACTNPLANLVAQGNGASAAAWLAADENVVYYQEVSGQAVTWHLQSADRYLDNGQRRALVRGIVPDFEDQAGDVALSLYVRDRPQSPATAKGPYTLGTSAAKKDFRASGRIMAARFAGTAFMRMGKPLFDVVPLGDR